MSRNKPRSPKRWSLQDAKNRFSAVVDAALEGRPQIVTRRGVATAVVISYEEYERIMAPPSRLSLAEYLLRIPKVSDGDDPFERIQLEPRDIDF
jgi:antitoxin Phd